MRTRGGMQRDFGGRARAFGGHLLPEEFPLLIGVGMAVIVIDDKVGHARGRPGCDGKPDSVCRNPAYF
jgi:hypothetical protein